MARCVRCKAIIKLWLGDKCPQCGLVPWWTMQDVCDAESAYGPHCVECGKNAVDPIPFRGGLACHECAEKSPECVASVDKGDVPAGYVMLPEPRPGERWIKLPRGVEWKEGTDPTATGGFVMMPAPQPGWKYGRIYDPVPGDLPMYAFEDDDGEVACCDAEFVAEDAKAGRELAETVDAILDCLIVADIETDKIEDLCCRILRKGPYADEPAKK